MSKFGAHVSQGPRTGIGAALKQCADAGSPVAGIIALDQNLHDDIITYSPTTLLAFRTQQGGDPNPPGIWQGDPVVVANDWYDFRLPIWLASPADIYIPCNEMDAATLEQFDWQNLFELQLMRRADEDELRLGIGVHSAGTPSDDGGSSRFQKWERLIPSLQYAKQNGHVLILHEYGMTTALPQSAPNLALRYKSIVPYLVAYNADCQIIIGECSDFNGYSGEGETWLNGLEWYDSQVITDPIVLFVGAYQLGGAENWQSLIPLWADYVATHPTPAPLPPAAREFDHWLDQDTGASLGDDNPLTFPITSNRRIMAVSRPKVTRYTCLVSSDSVDVAVTGGGEYNANQVVELTAVNHD